MFAVLGGKRSDGARLGRFGLFFRQFRRDGVQIDRRGDVVQREIRLRLLLQSNFFEDAAGLIVLNDALALLHIQQILLVNRAQLRHLLGRHAAARAFQMNQIA